LLGCAPGSSAAFCFGAATAIIAVEPELRKSAIASRAASTLRPRICRKAGYRPRR
jgi:hypothetical protein